MRRFLLVLGLVDGLSRGFDKSVKKKKVNKPAVKSKRPVAVVDKWGLPLEPTNEDDPVETIRSRTKSLRKPTLLSEIDTSHFQAPLEWAPRLRAVHLDPLVIRVEGFMTEAECDEVVSLSGRSKEMPKAAGTFDSSQALRRTSTTWYARFREPELAPLLGRAESLLGGDCLHKFEEVQIARYLEGEQFKWHEDAVPPSLLSGNDGGQRIATLLVYLSGEGDARKHGGATTFRDLGENPPLKIAPRKGDALLFFPAVEERGRYVPDDRTVHMAMPVLSGEKWVSQLWLHEKPYPPVILDDNERPDNLQLTLSQSYRSPPSAVNSN